MDVGKRAVRRLGKRIREIREKQGYSQEAFAEELGIARSYMSGLERGVRNPSFRLVAAIAETLKLTIAELCSDI